MKLPKLKVYLDSPTAIMQGHVLKIDDKIERPIGIISATAGTAGPKIGRAIAKEVVHRCNSHDTLMEALANARETLAIYRDAFPTHAALVNALRSIDNATTL